MSRRSRHDPEAVEPRQATISALEDLASCRTLVGFLALRHAGSGPRAHDVVHFAQIPKTQIEQPVAVEDARHLGDSERVRHRRLVLLRSLRSTLEPSRMILRRLPDDYEINCPGKAEAMISQDLSWLAKHGHVRKDGKAGGTRWALPVASGGAP